MWHLMFKCVTPGCGKQNATCLMCEECRKPLPVLDELTSFLAQWKFAITDFRRNVRAGWSQRSWQRIAPDYALIQQTA
eukprot:14637076-Alexandrium_andersonii.AAC.1